MTALNSTASRGIQQQVPLSVHNQNVLMLSGAIGFVVVAAGVSSNKEKETNVCCPRLFVYTTAKGGGLVESRHPTPPPPSRPPKVLEPVFLKFENSGETSGATRAGNFFGGLPEGKKLFFTLCVCTQNTKNFVENAKLVENQKNNFGLPTQPPGWTLADGTLS